MYTTANCERLPEWHIQVAQQQGPNTCAVEEVQELRRELWTECKYWLRRDVCGYQPVIRYVCCEGYTRNSTQFGCPQVKPLKNLWQTARDLGATDFMRYSLDSQIGFDLIQTHSPLTLFIPTNEAFRKLRGISKRIFEADIRGTLMYHIIAGRLPMGDTDGDHTLQTLLGGQTLQITKYSKNVFYANCLAIIHKNIITTNGIIHLIDGVLIPSKNWPLKPVLNTVLNDSRFKQLSRYINETYFADEMREMYGNTDYTMFAPNDRAFRKLSPKYLNRIASKPSLITALLRNHITPHTICPHALIADHTIKTIDGNDMIVSCNGNDRYINGVHMNGQMLGAANGVINVVDEVLIPDSVKSLYELVDKRQQLSSFKRTLDKCPEEVLVLEESNRAYSLFAPNNYAFEKLKSYQLGNILDNCRLFVESHLIPYRLTTKSITNNKTIYTLAKNRFINCTITAKGISVNSALIKEYDIEGANGVLHIIDEVLIIP
ncbi:unnamed protein product [Medioppia subpectinata]|uniref:FAS1 domain-containing protein n=1 Tax=Medioppia subpectinata TaxID=1979941 RepID=A0A7R9KCL0_9ACAR|nr:unnamed protein product [Medioppia subpectinata]CAG2100718.1 unnamed protein product [Medioppia subpectinata]